MSAPETSRLENVKRLLESTRSLPAGERETFLDTECGNDPALKDEVLSLLASIDPPDDFLESRPGTIELNVPAEEDSLVGRTIGPYLIKGIAGRGGMGVVYRGVRSDGQFRQEVAIKIVGYGFDSDYTLKRFRAERQVLANLKHPNITGLLDGGRTPDGLQYLVMEFIEGVPITKYVSEKHLSVTETLKLFQLVCDAVEYAHRNLVIHRDIKPGNILVTPEGTPKLLDFGIAKLLDDRSASGNLTKSEVVNLTPEYASPEQIAGDKITTASDVYSLGVLLYRLLTGRLPFSAGGLSIASIGRIISDENIPKPSDAVLNNGTAAGSPGSVGEKTLRRELSKLLKDDLDDIVLKALRHDPDRRYRSAEQLSDDIGRHLLGMPVIARPETARYVLSKFAKRHRVGVIVSLAVVMLAVAAMSVIVRESTITNREIKREKVDAEKAEKINDFLETMLLSVDPSQSGKDVKVYDVLKKAAGSVGTKMKGRPEIEAALQSTIGNAFVYLGQYDDARPHLERALELNKRTKGEMSDETANSLHDLAACYDWLGSLDSAGSLYEEADSVFEKVDRAPTEGMEINLNDYGLLENELGNYRSGYSRLMRALRIAEKLKGEKSYEVATDMNNIAVTLDNLNDPAGAERYYLKGEEIYAALYGDESVEVSTSYNNLAFIYVERKEFAIAKEYFLKSYELKYKLLGPNHPKVGRALMNLGYVEFEMKDYSSALKYFRRSLDQLQRVLPATHLWIGSCCYWMGRTLNATGSYRLAENYLRRSLHIRRTTFHVQNDVVSLSEGELGIALLNENEPDEAAGYLLEGYTGHSRASSMRDPNTIRFLRNIVRLYERKRDNIRARKYRAILDTLAVVHS